MIFWPLRRRRDVPNDVVDALNALNERIKRFENMSGHGINIIQTAGGIGLHVPRSRGNEGRAVDTYKWVKITGSTADGDNKWVYDWIGVAHTSAEYGGWAEITDDTGAARNTIENMNAATGVQGNGVDVANLVGTFAIQPAPAGAILPIYAVGDEYWFSYENGVDGGCAA